MISADDFLKERNQIQGKGKLLKFKNDILKLRKAGLTLSEICDFLEQNNVSSSIEAVRVFCKKHSASFESTITPPKNNKVELVKPATEKRSVKSVVPDTTTVKPESSKSKSDWTPPSWAPKDLNLDDYI
ncbi:hypothetical protein JHL22_10215 [Advenella sp. WQ 585]|uniref:Uncharacterized protein n=1 Tax=Advenella mandrilli TaxID=2800330 RepID=A0ABS1EEH7_9BURK|nr:hypothetical protein [Advenella mandrilli]MBK1781593.1 hypothetical protein [Advenella mandrilli]